MPDIEYRYGDRTYAVLPLQEMIVDRSKDETDTQPVKYNIELHNTTPAIIEIEDITHNLPNEILQITERPKNLAPFKDGRLRFTVYSKNLLDWPHALPRPQFNVNYNKRVVLI